jgi:antitoxin (DNA-binding transcriptional repressor) of toxin-antitoxin stability system
MQTVTTTDLTRHIREILDKVITQGATVIVERNDVAVARITPEVPYMTAVEALADLDTDLNPEEADLWLKDSRGDFDESVRDPWA